MGNRLIGGSLALTLFGFILFVLSYTKDHKITYLELGIGTIPQEQIVTRTYLMPPGLILMATGVVIFTYLMVTKEK